MAQWLRVLFGSLCVVAFFSAFYLSCSNGPTEPNTNRTEAIQIDADVLSIYSGGNIQLKAYQIKADGSQEDITSESNWSNSPALAGTVNDNGLFVAINNVTGLETITAEYKTKTASFDVEVTRRASWLGVAPVLIKVQAGNVLQLQAAVTYQGGTQAYVTEEVAWSISPGQAATVDDKGRVQTISGAAGKEIVTVNYHGWSSESEIDVQAQYQSRFDMVEIPAGSFVMGDDNGLEDEKPAHEVFVSRFEIGRYEVTNAEYARFLTEAFARSHIRLEGGSVVLKGKPPFLFLGMAKINSPEFDKQYIVANEQPDGVTTFHAVAGYENYPIGRLHWYGAMAFCEFYGVRLPTEAEWEKACRGGMQFEYGTVDGTISGDLANLAGTSGLDIYEEEAPVGTFPSNPYGLFDMAGNQSEFLFDLYDADYYKNSPTVDPTGPGPVDLMTRRANLIWPIRGGKWISRPEDARSARREIIDEPHDNAGVIAWAGFRIARSLP